MVARAPQPARTTGGAPDPAAEFRYVDTAFGGTDRRNNIRRVDLVQVNGQTDCYASYQRGTIELWSYLLEHRNKKGKPSVEGYPGSLWTPYQPLDFDHEEDPAVALEWLRRVLRQLQLWGVDLRAVRCYFSGGKGFHAELPAALFGGFEPSAALPGRLKRAAELLLAEIPFDGSIYDRLRLWRLENSRHGKSGLFKVRLSAREVLTLEMDAIRALAVAPRPIEDNPELAPLPDDELLPNEALAAIWREGARSAAEPTTRKRRAPAITDDARDRLTVVCIAASWPHGGRDAAGVSRHTDFLLPIAGFLSGHTSEQHALELLSAGAEAANDRDYLTGRDWAAEFERIAATSAARRESGGHFVGLPTLAERFPALAAVLGALWPNAAVDLSEGVPADKVADDRLPRQLPQRQAPRGVTLAEFRKGVA